METRSLTQVSTLFFMEYAHNMSVRAAGLKSRRATMRKGGTQRLYENFGDTTNQIHQSLVEMVKG